MMGRWIVGLLLCSLAVAPATHAQPAAPPASDTARVAVPDSLPAPAVSAATSQLTPFGGGQSTYRPYRQEPSVYFHAPAIRYNQVEGAVVGLQRGPLSWTGGAPVQPFGQVSYAFRLDEFRVVGGLEARLVQPTSLRPYGLKVGAHAARTTATEDDWKRSWEENSISSFLFGQDLFQYYEVRGVTAYAVQRFSPQLQVTTGARWAEHARLPGSAAPIDTGDVRVALLTVEGGRLTRWTEARSVGTIARLHTEIGHGFGAPLTYNRVVADVQTYRAVSRAFNLNLRGRLGLTTRGAPRQLQFRLNGVGGLRSFDPSVAAAERLLLGGAAWVWHDVPVPNWLETAQLRAFGDMGWTGDSRPPDGDTFAFVGLGASLFDRIVSVEAAWPLHATPTRALPAWRPQVTLKVHPLR